MHKARLILGLAAALLVPAGPGASQPVGDATDVAGGLRADMLVTDDFAGFTRAWERGDRATALPITTTINLGRPVFAMIAVAGCRAGGKGTCDIAVESRTAGPDGKFDAPRAGPPWRSPPRDDGGALLASAGIRLALDAMDPSGVYRIEAKVRDRIAGTETIISGSVRYERAPDGEGR